MDEYGVEFVLQNYWPIFAIMGAMVVGSMIYSIIHRKKMKSNKADFLAKHPDAAKIFLTSKALITQEAVTIHTVNGDHPVQFNESGKTGFYLIPGDNQIEISYTYTRPGVMYKRVTQSTGAVKKDICPEPNKSYILGYDREVNEFTFEELEEK